MPLGLLSVTPNENVHVVVNGLQAVRYRRVLLRRVVAEVVPSHEAREHLVGLCADLAIVLAVRTTKPRQGLDFGIQQLQLAYLLNKFIWLLASG